MHIWTRDEIMLRLIELQIGIHPPPGMSLEEAMNDFRSVAGEYAWRFERGAQFVWTEILALQQQVAKERAAKLDWMSKAALAYAEIEALNNETHPSRPSEVQP